MIDIDQLRQALGAVQPEEVEELLDRLEAAESEALEEARLNGMGGEREAALMAKLEAAEKERDAMRARIEQMERQEPVAIVEDDHNANGLGARISEYLPAGTMLYALPGAQGEEK